ncbi:MULTISPECIES: metallophosphoesterase [Flavobacteriaceae]|uniref:metallophosphoesterase n=1 Tax=Flavobacteriaceae TaxID=49546 RepID=UPI0014911166|nr:MULTISPECIES: metallophosphoesterase [Allomuricauda]MDC6366532.1 metallophosphoesterase [Muricauda sp. AC10]
MKKLVAFLFFILTLNFTIAQKKPTIYIDIPTQQKPWNHIEWNESPEQFQFAIVTDRTGGHRPGVFPVGIKKLNLLQPEFVMSVGDLIEGYTKDTVQLNAEWKEFKGFIEPLEAPFFYVPGNHDITNEVMEKKWKELFGVSYYHFVYKDVLFLCLNTEDNLRGAGRGTIGDEQYEYIKKTLEENSDVKWTLVFLHQPLWVQEDTKRWKDVEKLLENRSHNVFAGHYHRYWKTERNNGKYIALATTGGGSALRGKAYGEFDHVVWATMTEEGPILANLFLDGIWDENVVTEELVNLVRNKPFPVKIEPFYSDEMTPENMVATVKATNHTDTKMQVSLTGNANDDLFYQLEKTSFTVEPNDVVTFKLNLKNVDKKKLEDLSTLKVNTNITYEFEERPNVSFSSVLNFKPFYKYALAKAQKIKLDGNLKDWKDATWHSVTHVDGAPFDYDGENDLSLKFATAYDTDNFYVAVDITDNNFMKSEKGSYWNQDGLIIGLDARPKHISAFNKGEGRGKDWIAYLRTFKKDNPVYHENSLPVKVSAEVKMTDTGAIMELAFPMEYINKMSNGNWSDMRFGIGYYDYDAQDEGATTHFWFPAWNGQDDIPGSGTLFKK